MIRHQISVFVENEPGVLARVARALGEASVNLRAISISDAVDDGVLRVIVDDERCATEVLEHVGALCVSRDVIEVELPDRPGALAELASVLAGKGIDIGYAYGAAAGDAGAKARLWLRIPNRPAAEVDAVIRAHLGT